MLIYNALYTIEGQIVQFTSKSGSQKIPIFIGIFAF